MSKAACCVRGGLENKWLDLGPLGSLGNTRAKEPRGPITFSWVWTGAKIVLESFSRFNTYEPFWRPARLSLFSWLGLAWSGLVDMGGYGGYGRILVDF